MAEDLNEPILHPYVGYIKHRLEALLEFVQLESDGRAVEADGFRLKNLEKWCLEKDGGLFRNLDSISSYCNAKCEFCYELGNPLPYERSMLSLEEVATRARYFDPATGMGILHPALRLSLEPFTNPNLIDIIQNVRRKSPGELIILTTNGSFLTPKMIEQIAGLQPVVLSVSVNCCSAGTRRRMMGDNSADTALGALRLLEEKGIRFVGTIVAWHTIPPEELLETIRFIDRFSPYSIRVTLPGYSRYFSGGELFDTDSIWSAFCDAIESIRPQISAPVMVLPHLFANPPLIPRIDGVVKNSPAQLAGVRYGDIITRINDKQVLTKGQARAWLKMAEGPGSLLELEVQRNGSKLAFRLGEADDEHASLYPYKVTLHQNGGEAAEQDPDANFGSRFGIFLAGDFEIGAIPKMMELINGYGARNVLLLSSAIMKPNVETIIASIPEYRDYFSGINFDIYVPEHAFWGGNILIGDLYLVSDYLGAVREFIAATGRRPDLVLLPGSFANEFGCDLAGQSFTAMERAFKIPVEMVECSRIYM